MEIIELVQFRLNLDIQSIRARPRMLYLNTWKPHGCARTKTQLILNEGNRKIRARAMREVNSVLKAS